MKTDLWSDKKFIEKRIKEQCAYRKEFEIKLNSGRITKERFEELNESCKYVYDKFVRRWKYLNERETIERLSDTANFIG